MGGHWEPCRCCRTWCLGVWSSVCVSHIRCQELVVAQSFICKRRMNRAMLWHCGCQLALFSQICPCSMMPLWLNMSCANTGSLLWIHVTNPFHCHALFYWLQKPETANKSSRKFIPVENSVIQCYFRTFMPFFLRGGEGRLLGLRRCAKLEAFDKLWDPWENGRKFRAISAWCVMMLVFRLPFDTCLVFLLHNLILSAGKCCCAAALLALLCLGIETVIRVAWSDFRLRSQRRSFKKVAGLMISSLLCAEFSENWLNGSCCHSNPFLFSRMRVNSENQEVVDGVASLSQLVLVGTPPRLWKFAVRGWGSRVRSAGRSLMTFVVVAKIEWIGRYWKITNTQLVLKRSWICRHLYT